MLVKLHNGRVEETHAEQVNNVDFAGCCWLDEHGESLGDWIYVWLRQLALDARREGASQQKIRGTRA